MWTDQYSGGSQHGSAVASAKFEIPPITLRTPVLWGYWPVRPVARDGQQLGSVTNALSKTTASCTSLVWICGSSPIESISRSVGTSRSSVVMTRIFGLPAPHTDAGRSISTHTTTAADHFRFAIVSPRCRDVERRRIARSPARMGGLAGTFLSAGQPVRTNVHDY